MVPEIANVPNTARKHSIYKKKKGKKGRIGRTFVKHYS